MQISLHHLLKSLGVKSIQFYGWEGCKIKSKNIWEIIPNDGIFLKESFQSVLTDNGFNLADNAHPNKEMHKLFAEFLINKLKKLNYI
jgi:lysophospholipase L1-like esterase